MVEDMVDRSLPMLSKSKTKIKQYNAASFLDATEDEIINHEKKPSKKKAGGFDFDNLIESASSSKTQPKKVG